MKVDSRNEMTPLEQRLASCGFAVIINQYLPDGISIEKPPNKLFEKKLSLHKNCNPDKTMSVWEKKSRTIMSVGGIGFCMALFLFLMNTEKKSDYKSYHSFKPKDVTEAKSTPIDEVAILETYTKDEEPQQGRGLFGNNKVKIGDKVSYQQGASNLVDTNGKDRNFNTPLLIVADDKPGIGGKSAGGEKLAVPTNTYAYVYLERDVMSGNLTAPLTAVTYLDVKLGNKTLIPKDSRLVGQCQKVNGNRIVIRFDSVILSSGREYTINGQALGEDNLVGVIGDVDRNVAKKTSNLFASSLLDSTAQTLNLTGNSFGTIFAGNMADHTSDSLDNVVDESMARSGMTIKVPANTRFKILFE